VSDAPEIGNLFHPAADFSAVISIVIVLLGLFSLSPARCGELSAPHAARDPGAGRLPGRDSAQDVADGRGWPIEQQLSGMEGLLYFKSANSSDGVMKPVGLLRRLAQS